MEKMENRLDSLVNTLQSFNEGMHQMKNILKNIPSNGYYMHFDDIIMGKKIMLRNNLKTAIRKTPFEDDGYAGVLSNIPLRNEVPFEIRIDETIDKWRDYGIGLGVIVKKEEAVQWKWSICNDVQGTDGIWSWWNTDSGKSDIYKDGSRISYNAYHLDTRNLPVGTTLGVVRTWYGAVIFLLNGRYMSVAFYNVPDGVYAFYDTIHYVTQITIIS